MEPALAFALALSVTLVLLGFVVLTGVKARVRAHIPLVASAIASLGVTIYFAERLGDHYDLAKAGWITPVHLALAKTATLAYLLPIATGIRTLRDRSKRRAHFWSAMLVLALTVLTAITGTWMVLASPRLD